MTLWSPQYSFILLSWCRNVTVRSPTIVVSERDTPIHYYPCVGTWHSDPLLSWCRKMTLQSPNILVPERGTPIPSIFIHLTILVSERDTPIPYYPSVGTWHSDPLLSWCRNVTLRSSTILVSESYTRSSTILVSERDTRSPNLILSVHQAFFYTKASSLTKRF